MSEREEGQARLSEADVDWEAECFLHKLRRGEPSLWAAWESWCYINEDDLHPADVSRIRAAIMRELQAERRATPPQEPQP